MSRWFVLPDEKAGKGGDIVFRKYGNNPNWYRLFVGDKEFGFVTKNQMGWSAWSYNFDNKTMDTHVDGFKSRLMAGFFIVKHWGYWKQG